ncbi:AAA ATPase [Ancistrocladus abbreviatus]
MLALADRTTAAVPGGNGLKEANAGGVENCGDIRSGRPQKRMLRSHKTAEESLISSPTTTPQKRLLRSHKTAEESLISSPTTMPPKRMLRSHTTAAEDSLISSPSSKNLSPVQWKSPRRCISCSPNSPLNGNDKEFGDKLATSREFLLKKSWDALFVKSRWNPRDSEQMRAVKEALHVSTMPSSVVCREDEQARVFIILTGKTMIMEKVKQSLNDWSKEEGIQQPDVLSMNCTSLTNASEVFCKILQKIQPQNKTNGSAAALKHIQNMYSGQGQSSKKLL